MAINAGNPTEGTDLASRGWHALHVRGGKIIKETDPTVIRELEEQAKNGKPVWFIFDEEANIPHPAITNLDQMLNDAYARIEQAVMRGEDVSSWETFWRDLLDRYEETWGCQPTAGEGV